MLTLLADYSHIYGPLNLFRYITFRSLGAVITALLFVFMFGPSLIDWLRLKQGKGQPIRTDGPESHFAKRGTPTMGGLMILAGLVISTLLWANLKNIYVWVVLFVTIGFGLIGFYDDYLKVKKQSHAGFSSRMRLGLEFLIAGIAVYICSTLGKAPAATSIYLPFLRGWALELGFVFIIFGALVIVGSGNAVNLTDGLDGLAIVPVILSAGALGLIAYLAGHAVFSDYLGINHVTGTGEVGIVMAALIGAGLGFLWFNAPPAQIFMGDTGSLALGGLLGSVAVVTKHELVWFIIGGLFVVEALSVIIQVASFKLTGKRVFAMAPIHHHFEKKGWKEPQIVVRFWIIAFVLTIIGLSTLKLR